MIKSLHGNLCVYVEMCVHAMLVYLKGLFNKFMYNARQYAWSRTFHIYYYVFDVDAWLHIWFNCLTVVFNRFTMSYYMVHIFFLTFFLDDKAIFIYLQLCIVDRYAIKNRFILVDRNGRKKTDKYKVESRAEHNLTMLQEKTFM